MFKLVLEKAEVSEIKLSTSAGSTKIKRIPEKHLFLLYWLCQSPWLCGSQKTVENSSRDGNTSLSDLPPEKYAGQKVTDRTRHGKTDWFQFGKGVHQYNIKAVYCHPAYLTYMQNTSCEMLGWMKHQLESRLLGEISTTSDMQMTPPLWQKVKKN